MDAFGYKTQVEITFDEMVAHEKAGLTDEQSREYQAYALWAERDRLTDDQLTWMAESFPEYFEIKDEVFDMKKFKSSFKL